MVEPEMAYFQHEDSLDLQERFVSAVVGEVLSECEDELASLERDTTLLEKTKPPFPRITYDEALEILARNGIDREWGEDFGAPDETLLASQFDRPVFVERFPSSCKPFYTQPAPDRPEVALCDDLLAPEGYGEIIGGSERVHDFDLLRNGGCGRASCRRMTINGISIFAGTAACRIAGSGWESNAPSLGYVGYSTCGKRSRSRECWTASTLRSKAQFWRFRQCPSPGKRSCE